MSVKTVLNICCLLMMSIQVIKGLRCYVCNDAKSEKDCNWKTETCAINQGSCFTEIRNFGKEIRLKKSCYQKQACNNLIIQSENHACPRVCALCCQGDLCNIKPPHACSCGLTTRSPPRTQPSRRPNPRRTSRKPTARTRPRTTADIYRRSTTTSSASTTNVPTTTTTTTISTSTKLLEVSVTVTAPTTNANTESSTVNLLQANPSSTRHVSHTTFTSISHENPNATGTSMSRITEKIQQTTALHAGDIKLDEGEQNASTTPVTLTVSTSPTSCGEIAFVPTPDTNKKIISCQNSMKNKMVCASNVGMDAGSKLLNLFTYNQSTNATEYHQCQTQPTNISVSTTYDRLIPILCIRNSNQSNIRQFRRQKMLISGNLQNDNATHSVECRLVYLRQNRQFGESHNEEIVVFKSDTIERMEKLCDKQFFGIQCSVSLKSAAATETTPAVKAASGNPSWMIPVIVVAVVVVVILGIVVILASLRKTGFYRVRKKVKPDEKDKK